SLEYCVQFFKHIGSGPVPVQAARGAGSRWFAAGARSSLRDLPGFARARYWHRLSSVAAAGRSGDLDEELLIERSLAWVPRRVRRLAGSATEQLIEESRGVRRGRRRGAGVRPQERLQGSFFVGSRAVRARRGRRGRGRRRR